MDHSIVLTFMYVTISFQESISMSSTASMIRCQIRTIVALCLLAQPRKESLAVKASVPTIPTSNMVIALPLTLHHMTHRG